LPPPVVPDAKAATDAEDEGFEVRNSERIERWINLEHWNGGKPTGTEIRDRERVASGSFLSS
jgi:hypothetical protein